MADDLDGECGFVGRRRVGVAEQDEVGDDEESDEDDDGDHDPEGEDERGVDALVLAEEGQAGLVAPHPGEYQQRDGAEEDDAGRDEHPPPQRGDVVGVRAFRIQWRQRRHGPPSSQPRRESRKSPTPGRSPRNSETRPRNVAKADPACRAEPGVAGV